MTHDWPALQRTIEGELVLPGSLAYERVRRPPIGQFAEIRPAAVVRCRSAADVAETIAFARRSGLQTVPRGGGHCFAGRSSTTGIVIDLTPMSAVVVADGVATIGAGARLGDVYDSLAGHGLTMAAGCGPEVGIAGLTLGGGLGILGRRHGLTSDQLVGAEVVLADGRIVECDEGRNEDLFWALRGAGGGQFGVVTSLRHRTLPAPEQATSFHLVWPVRLAAAVIGAWQAWAPAAPDELAASLLVTAGPDPGRPPLVNVFGAMLGGAAATAGLLEELVARVGAGPESQSSREAPYRHVKRHLAEHGPGEAEPDGHPYSKSEFFRRPLPDEAVDALVDRFCRGRVAGVSRELDFTPWGGAYNRVPSDATAFAHRDELFLLKHGIVVAPGASSSAREAGRAWLRRSWELVHPCGSGGVYPNFPDPELEGWERAYHGDNHERLARVKRRYDPESFFSFPQSLIGPLAGDLGETPV